MKRLLALLALSVSCAMPWQASAAEPVESLTDEDQVAIQAVVQTQLDALADDDAAIAFEQTTDQSKLQIGSPDNFMRMIKEQYNPVYQHQLALFSDPRVVHGMVLQVVRLTSRDSHVWLALFRMERDEGQAWKIDGCQLLETTSLSI
ncbi:protein of unknown function [Noviherbaspirillum humi]|uniref:DUF4864 domain-containing protein n=1 Tax=Noviherbaspirillum humi TaxID=1688639 RepID=A0A239J5V4_9BURK|nr:DUF4864 domain-containing protein [Noviherbaspirillum humi]SNT01237.1 protein of unknown function [Noviherbaspirillum humi]